MAEKILIMGESGTGKSTSLRNFTPEEVAVVNPVGKPLPFKGGMKFESLDAEIDSRKIVKFMQNTKKKIIVIDDFQYLLSIPYMNRIKEAGWDKWNDFASNYFEIIDVCQDLPKDVTVYFMTHTETLESGVVTIKLIGKLLREKITIEGLFTTVLRTQVVDGKYYFLTQNSGKDTVKSPMGMFPSYAIDNDLKYVDEKLRNYYEIGNFKADHEIAELDDQAKTDLEKPNASGRRSRTVGQHTGENDPEGAKAARSSKDKPQEENTATTPPVDAEQPKITDAQDISEAAKVVQAELEKQQEQPTEGRTRRRSSAAQAPEVSEPPKTEAPTRRSRKVRDAEGFVQVNDDDIPF